MSKTTQWEWNEEQYRAFEEMKTSLQRTTETQHFKRDEPLRIVCDASDKRLGAVLQQKTVESWQVIHFASTFLTIFEQKYSFNELELLAVAWTVENFRNCVYGTIFEIVSDHKALSSILKGNKANKTVF